jgi:putative transposase
MISKQLLRALAVMGIRLTHSKPGEPAGRGKIERFFRTVRDQFLVELSTPGALEDVKDLARLNALFTAWVETVYHHNVHSQTGQEPLARFLAAGPPDLPDPGLVVEAFCWAHERLVTKTATVNLFGNVYEVDAALVGRKVELVFDPLDLTELQVRYQGRDMGKAIPHKITKHVHPNAATKTTPTEPAPTGIEYLKTVATSHQATLAARINYANLPTRADAEPDPGGGDSGPADTGEGDPVGEELPGQLDLTDLVAHGVEGGRS